MNKAQYRAVQAQYALLGRAAPPAPWSWDVQRLKSPPKFSTRQLAAPRAPIDAQSEPASAADAKPSPAVPAYLARAKPRPERPAGGRPKAAEPERTAVDGVPGAWLDDEGCVLPMYRERVAAIRRRRQMAPIGEVMTIATLRRGGDE